MTATVVDHWNLCVFRFIRIDSTFRQYFAKLRSAVLNEKTICCDPNLPLGRTPIGICQEQKFPNITAHTSSKAVVKKADSHASDIFKDVTSDWIDKMTLSCDHYVYATAMALFNPDWTKLKETDPARPWINPHNLTLHAMAAKYQLADSFVCAERAYPDEAHFAFAGMGAYFFPPQIKKLSGSLLQLSCGGKDVSLDVYDTAQWVNNGYHNAPVSKDPHCQDIFSNSGSTVVAFQTITIWSQTALTMQSLRLSSVPQYLYCGVHTCTSIGNPAARSPPSSS